MSADIVYHVTGAISLFVSLVLLITAIKRLKEVRSIDRKIVDALYAVIALGYTIFFALSQFHFWSEIPDSGNFIAKILHTLMVTTITIDLINRHRRGEC
jgi:hypothetical protein